MKTVTGGYGRQNQRVLRNKDQAEEEGQQQQYGAEEEERVTESKTERPSPAASSAWAVGSSASVLPDAAISGAPGCSAFVGSWQSSLVSTGSWLGCFAL
jgi:hypothetical protein